MLVEDDDASARRGRRFLKAERGDERAALVADERIGEAVFRLEEAIRAWRVGAEAVDREAVRREGLVCIAEEAGLLDACCECD